MTQTAVICVKIVIITPPQYTLCAYTYPSEQPVAHNYGESLSHPSAYATHNWDPDEQKQILAVHVHATFAKTARLLYSPMKPSFFLCAVP